MIKTYYKFHLDKESIIKEQQDIVWSENTCISWIYIDTDTPTLTDSTIECQNGWFIKYWLPEFIGEGVGGEVSISAQELSGFLVEKLFSQELEGHYYESFTLE